MILSPIEAFIKRKIEAVGVPLKDWDINIYRGILTGYNEAFIIDGKTKDELIKASPKNAEIIRPILLGKNIKRYTYNWENLWLINTHNGIKGRSEPINVDEDYPIIYEYLKKFQTQLKTRFDKGHHWTNLRNCAYIEDFEKPKIAWGNLGMKGQFALIKEPMYINAPSSFFSTDKFYLLGILNSKVADFYIKQLGVTRNGGYFEYKPMFIEQLPVPKLSSQQIIQINKHIEKITSNPSIENKESDSALENLIFDIYNLTNDERNYLNSPKFQ